MLKPVIMTDHLHPPVEFASSRGSKDSTMTEMMTGKGLPYREIRERYDAGLWDADAFWRRKIWRTRRHRPTGPPDWTVQAPRFLRRYFAYLTIFAPRYSNGRCAAWVVRILTLRLALIVTALWTAVFSIALIAISSVVRPLVPTDVSVLCEIATVLAIAPALAYPYILLASSYEAKKFRNEITFYSCSLSRPRHSSKNPAGAAPLLLRDLRTWADRVDAIIGGEAAPASDDAPEDKLMNLYLDSGSVLDDPNNKPSRRIVYIPKTRDTSIINN